MANTKIKQQRVIIEIPNKIARRMLRAKKFYNQVPTRQNNHWAALRKYKPQMFFGLITKIKGA